MMKPVIFIVTYIAKPGERETFIDKIFSGSLVDKIRAEEGCISYEYFRSVEDENALLLMEKWETLEHQQTHLKQPHMAQLKEIKDKHVISTTVEMARPE